MITQQCSALFAQLAAGKALVDRYLRGIALPGKNIDFQQLRKRHLRAGMNRQGIAE
ncbi:MAG: hypothetical protein G5701_05925 [Serratia symbiotica]|nr:hypothetical protein [Serratia symbiotica]